MIRYKTITPRRAKKTNTCSGPRTSLINPPKNGPTKGPIAIIIEMYPNIMVASFPLYISPTIALAKTIPAAQLACRNLRKIKR